MTERTVQFVLGDARHRVDVGSFAFVPHGVAHALSDPGPGRARILVIGSAVDLRAGNDGGGRALQSEDTPDPKAVAEAYERFDSELCHQLHPDKAAAVAARTADARPHIAASACSTRALRGLPAQWHLGSGSAHSPAPASAPTTTSAASVAATDLAP